MIYICFSIYLKYEVKCIFIDIEPKLMQSMSMDTVDDAGTIIFF